MTIFRPRNALIAIGAMSIATAGYFASPYFSKRALFVHSLFRGGEQYQNFSRMADLFPTEQVPASSHPEPWPAGAYEPLPAQFETAGHRISVKDLLAATDTAALLVIRDGKIVHEDYFLTGGPKVRWLSMSVAKSVVSALVGCAISDRLIGGVSDPITRYLPELRGSAYDGVSIKDILQMSSGAQWREDYSDPRSDVFRLGVVMANGKPIDEFPATLKREHKPGTYNRYNSADTLVLGMLIQRVTKKSLAQYTEEKLWSALGAESEAFWLTDDHGAAIAFAGFNATARDYARLGELYRLNGMWRGRQVVPAWWVKDSTTPDSPHVMPGKRRDADSVWGYGYQWWVPSGGKEPDFSAVGVYNQFIYVNPLKHVVIVKLSANHRYGSTNDDTFDREGDTIAMFRAIADQR